MNARKASDTIFFSGACLIALFLPFSKLPLLSIGTGLIAFSAFFSLKKDMLSAHPYKWVLLALALLFIIPALSIFVTDDFKEYNNKLTLRLSIILLAFGFLPARRPGVRWHWLAGVFIFSVTLVAVMSVMNYFFNRELIDDMVSRSKAVPVTGGTHHIHFSVMQALAVGFMVSGITSFPAVQNNKKLKVLLVIILLLNIICMHILTTRTGLFAFYASVFCLVVYRAVTGGHIKQGIIALLVIVALPSIAYLTVSSFRNRVKNTMADLEIAMHNRDNNYQSMGMRLEAWKTASDIIKKHPLTGVGLGDVKWEMRMQYIRNNSHLYEENRLEDTHNQYIQSAAQAGLPGLAALLFLFVTVFASRRLRVQPLVIYTTLLVFFSLCVETMLERQVGLVTLIFSLLLAISLALRTQENP